MHYTTCPKPLMLNYLAVPPIKYNPLVLLTYSISSKVRVNIHFRPSMALSILGFSQSASYKTSLVFISISVIALVGSQSIHHINHNLIKLTQSN